jgi:hypothetical protein
VDHVGIWGEVDWDDQYPPDPDRPRIEEVRVKSFVRNGSKLPIEAEFIAWEIKTNWLVPHTGPSGQQGWVSAAGKPCIMSWEPGLVGPQTTVQSDWQTIRIDHSGPAQAVALAPGSGAKCVVRHALVTDNAGRLWEVRPRRGKRARRVRLYSRTSTGDIVHWRYKVNAAKRRLLASIAGIVRRVSRRSSSS